MNDRRSAEPGLGEARGDYVACDVGYSGGGNDTGRRGGDARKAALDELGDRDGWNN